MHWDEEIKKAYIMELMADDDGPMSFLVHACTFVMH